MRRIWTAAGSLFTVFALVAGTAQAVDVLAREEVIERATFSAAGISVLAVNTHNGRVEVVGTTGDRIEVVATVSGGLWRTHNRMAVSGSRIELGATCPGFGLWCSLHYRVRVPRHVNVDVVARNGWIELSGLAGTVRVSADNGWIRAHDLAGDAQLTTRNGFVLGRALRSPTLRAETRNGNVVLSFAAAPSSVTGTTRNGTVDILVPDTAHAYRVDVQTAHGSTDIGIRTDPDSERTIVADTRNGDIRLRYP